MKTILITGANKGIGFETAKQLARQGYFVYLGSRNRQRGLEAVSKLQEAGLSNVALLELDVSNLQSIKEARMELEGAIGALDVLINNAGISGPQSQHISTIAMEDLKRVLEINFFGAVQVTQEFIPLLEKSGNPVIVNVSSGLGSLALHGNKPSSSYDVYDAYSISKTALNAFTVMLANEFKDTNFRINSVAPGYTATDLNHFQGTQTVEEAAQKVIQYVILDEHGPTGNFFDGDVEVPW